MLKMVPNILTFGRLALTILFLGMLLYVPQVHDKIFTFDAAFTVFIIAALTDIIDGPIARKLNVASKLGRMLDPLADKILVCGAFLCFAIIRSMLLALCRGQVEWRGTSYPLSLLRRPRRDPAASGSLLPQRCGYRDDEQF